MAVNKYLQKNIDTFPGRIYREGMSKTRWKRPKGKCRSCGKLIELSAPTGNWLDALFPWKHRLKSGKVCEGTWTETEITVDEAIKP
jgi:hypothetical protein